MQAGSFPAEPQGKPQCQQQVVKAESGLGGRYPRGLGGPPGRRGGEQQVRSLEKPECGENGEAGSGTKPPTCLQTSAGVRALLPGHKE